METLHLVPGPSAAESLRAALGVDTDDPASPVQSYPDDPSVGPLKPDDPAVREQWWHTIFNWLGPEESEESDPFDELAPAAFWERVECADHLVVWFSSASNSELAFFHLICDRLSDRPFDIVQVPGPVGALSRDECHPLLAAARPITGVERRAAAEAWRRLKQENATFRIITPAGLASAPEDYYDAALLDTAGSKGTALGIVVGTVLATTKGGDSTLYWRIAKLVESGALLADGPLATDIAARADGAPRPALGTRIKRASLIS
ncbi:DUF3658 domain-containing protein [Streptomyces sp. YGL11-2]|uniref:DUF3658 domain-containing protein n=1 Tax=Streptomyces sp. YGL11-2 TaxID=3414028 RepID=UPI003CE845B8